eukprot:SAG31_NODE_47126_length_251_cov_1.190789_1_plen_43_part_01
MAGQRTPKSQLRIVASVLVSKSYFQPFLDAQHNLKRSGLKSVP